MYDSTLALTPQTEEVTTIAAVVVTFNRLGLLKECIAALQAQTRKPDNIIIINNGSTDGTADWLKHQPGLLVVNQQNTGGAGGFYTGIKKAYENNYDWIWIMDDDCRAAGDCLEQMFSSLSNHNAICVAPMVLNGYGVADARHRGYFGLPVNSAMILRPIDTKLDNDIDIDFGSFVGLMLSARAVKMIGLPHKELFIHNDDVEYCLRLSAVGNILLSVKAKIYHLENAVSTDIEKKFLNHYRGRPPIEKLWIKYYGVRNAIWIKKKYMAAGSPVNKAKLIAYMILSFTRHLKDILLYDDYKVKRCIFYLSAYLDGWNGTFKNDRPKQILKVL